MDIKREVDTNTVIVGDFNATLTSVDRSSRQKIKKETVDLNGTLSGVPNLLASLGHTGRRVVLGHTLNTQTLMKTDEQKKGFK